MSTSVTRIITDIFEHEDFILMPVITKIYPGDFRFNKLPNDFWELIWRTPKGFSIDQIANMTGRIAAFVHGWILRGDM